MGEDDDLDVGEDEDLDVGKDGDDDGNDKCPTQTSRFKCETSLKVALYENCRRQNPPP